MQKLWLLALIPAAVGVAVVVVVVVQIHRSNPHPTVSETLRTNARLSSALLPTSVDVVYTWVDSSDQQWRAQRDSLTKRRIRAQLKTEAVRWPVMTDSLTELSLSVSTVRKFLPWVRHIYVVTQRPQRIDDASLHFVHHDELMDIKNLPSFNSKAIETSIHKIPGLSEHFIYMNDDFYIGKPMEVFDFFSPNGKPIFYPARKLKNWAVKQPWFAREAKKSVGAMPGLANMHRIMPHNVYYTNHMASALTRGVMYDTERAYKTAWDSTQSSRFRDSTDVPPVTMSLNHGYHTGKVDVVKHTRIDGLNPKIRNLGKLRKKRPYMFSVNDVTSEKELHQLRDYIQTL